MSWINGPSISPCNLQVSASAGGSTSILQRLSDTLQARVDASAVTPASDDAEYRWKTEMRFLHPAQASYHLGVGTGTVLAWARKGWIRYDSDGGRHHHAYSSEDVLQLAGLMRGRGHPCAHLVKALGWPDRGGRDER